MMFLRTARRAGLALFIASAMAVTAVQPALSQAEISPEHLALARQYVEMSDRAAVYELRVIELGTSVMRLLIQQNPDLADPVGETVRAVANQYVEEKGDLYNQFARIYASRFTMEELQQIVDFYSTETGQKLLAQNPGINQDLSNVLQIWENNARTEFLARVRASLREQGHNV